MFDKMIGNSGVREEVNTLMRALNNISKKNKTIICILLGLFAIAIVPVLLVSQSKYEPQTYHFNTSLDMAIGGTVESSVERARDIVYGHYTGHIKEMSTGTFRIGDLYTFQVEEAWLGDAKGEIPVVISSHFTLSQTVDNYTYSANVRLPHYVKPDFNKKYILILDYNEAQDVYVSALIPNHIEMNNDEVASLKYNRDTEAISKNDKGDKAIFSVEGLKLTKDDITGLTKDELLKKFKSEISKKLMQAE